ncbi:MAG: hypothetical protein ACR2OT_00565 [Parvibaculales bacterium]
MTKILNFYRAVVGRIGALLDPWLLPHLARFAFAAVLAAYYWVSAMTKFEDGVWGFLHLTFGAYYQILPQVVEAAGHNPDNISPIYTVIVLLGSWAEVILPALIILGLFTRGAALAMIGFIVVQSLTDIFGHNLDAESIGAWFDRASDSLILDQRLFWVSLLLVLVVKGGGYLSLDYLLGIDRK